MNSYKIYSSARDAAEVFRELKIDVLPEDLAASYAGWTWTVRRCDEFPLILNALPPEGRLEELFWEEWFIMDAMVHHHILSIREPVSFEKIYQAPDADEIHPPEVLGKRWYEQDYLNREPVLFKGEDEFLSLWVEERGKLGYRRRKIAEPGEAEVLVRIKACGICGTDIHFLNDLPEGRPMPLGHELAGIIERVGSGVNAVRAGDKVVIQNNIACGTCPSCLKGRKEKCSDIQSYMDDKAGLAEFLTVPAAMVIPFDKLEYMEAAVAEPLTVSMDLIDRAGIEEGERVLVVGPGIIGLCALSLAKKKGAGRVVMSGRFSGSARAAHREGASYALGADETVNAAAENWKEELKARFPEGFDKIIVTAPPAVIPDYLGFLAFGGDLIYNGISFSDDRVSFSANDLHFNKNSIIASHAIPNWGFEEALDMIRNKEIPARDLISCRTAFHRAEDGIRACLNSDKAVVKSMILFD
jgi:threonine dehydrogenase-like Zn-dependent dehydrogenase